MTSKELNSKTVFDFADYPAIIKEITGIDVKDSDRIAYYRKTCHPINKARDIEYLAYRIQNKPLEAAASALCHELEGKRGKEADEAIKNGYIID